MPFRRDDDSGAHVIVSAEGHLPLIEKGRIVFATVSAKKVEQRGLARVSGFCTNMDNGRLEFPDCVDDQTTAEGVCLLPSMRRVRTMRKRTINRRKWSVDYDIAWPITSWARV